MYGPQSEGYSPLRGYYRNPGVPCAETGLPSFSVENALVVGTGYQWPVYYYIAGTPTRNPTSMRAEFLSEVVAGPGPVDDTTLCRAFTGDEVGTSPFDIYLTNCFGTDFGNSAIDIQSAGWATGEPRALIRGTLLGSMDADPASINFASLFVWTDSVNTVTIVDTTLATTVFTGAISGSMVNNSFYDCAKFAALSDRPTAITFTNGIGSMTLNVTLSLQDFLATCP
jgi:hypothetical protein